LQCSAPLAHGAVPNSTKPGRREFQFATETTDRWVTGEFQYLATLLDARGIPPVARGLAVGEDAGDLVRFRAVDVPRCVPWGDLGKRLARVETFLLTLYCKEILWPTLSLCGHTKSLFLLDSRQLQYRGFLLIRLPSHPYKSLIFLKNIAYRTALGPLLSGQRADSLASELSLIIQGRFAKVGQRTTRRPN
jgi:hypothetical protein